MPVSISPSDALGGGDGIVLPPHPLPTPHAPPCSPAVLIFLHGRGDTAAGWAPAFPLRGSPPLTAIVLPTAPAMPITHVGGAVMPAWFDARPAASIPDARTARASGLAAAVARLSGMVAAAVAAGVPADRIVVGGFSQGAAVAAELLAAGTWRLGGGVLVGGWLPTGAGGGEPHAPAAAAATAAVATAAAAAAAVGAAPAAEAATAGGRGADDTAGPRPTAGATGPPDGGPAARPLRGVPILVLHGVADPAVPAAAATAAAAALTAAGAAVSVVLSPGLGHTISGDQLRAVGRFLTAALPPARRT